MTSFRLRIAGALGFAFLPLYGDMFRLVLPPARAADAPAKGTPQTFSRSRTIRLPLQMDEKAQAVLSEIRLFVKTPDSDWRMAQSGPPTQAAFDFKAETDGSYAFMFVTVDKKGQSLPSNLDARPPHQIIVVDTAAPELSVMPLPVANRDIYLQVRMKDANPDWASIKLEYQVGDDSWKSMEQARHDAPGVFRIPHASVLEGKVRATGKDKASNVVQRVFDLGDATKPFGQPDRLPPAVAAEPAPKGELIILQKDDPAPPELKQTSMKVAGKEAPRPNGYNPNRTAPHDPADPVVIPEVPGMIDATVAEPKPPVEPKPAFDTRQPNVAVTDPYFPPITPPTEGPKPEPVAAVVEPAKLTVEPMPAKVEPAPLKMEPAKAETKPVQAPKGNCDIINTQRCTLDYAIENVVIGGLPKVEFWATRDNGRSWIRVQDESGGRTPARLVLPGDGLFGIRVKANGGGQSPHESEAPDAWVEVDTTRPQVRLLPTVIGTGPDAGTLTIQWMAQDKNLIADSVSVFHASRPDGPWLPIATNIRNDGHYRWLIPNGIGQEIYLRVEATDRAGNLGQAETRDPVPMPQPRVKVLGIGPAR